MALKCFQRLYKCKKFVQPKKYFCSQVLQCVLSFFFLIKYGAALILVIVAFIGTIVDGATCSKGAITGTSSHTAERTRCGLVWWNTVWCVDRVGWSIWDWQNTSNEQLNYFICRYFLLFLICYLFAEGIWYWYIYVVFSQIGLCTWLLFV